MESAQLTGTVYTDYQKAARVANNPSLLHSMGRDGDLPLFQYLILQLNRNPRIQLEHVKAHGIGFGSMAILFWSLYHRSYDAEHTSRI
jgi:hypothetical protein